MTATPTIAIIGAGPVGIDAALTALEQGYSVRLFEAAQTIGGHVRRWRHVRMFTPWSYDLSPGMRGALEQLGITFDAELCPTGADLLDDALEPLATRTRLREVIQLGTSVLSVGRRGLLKHEEIGSAVRSQRPFRLLTRTRNGNEEMFEADLVFDCSGLVIPNPLGDGGVPAIGEVPNQGEISTDIPVIGPDFDPTIGKNEPIMIVGSGHSAQTAVRDLGRAMLSDQHRSGRLLWVVRGGDLPAPDPSDPLPERQQLLTGALAVVAESRAAHSSDSVSRESQVEVVFRAVVEKISSRTDGQLEVTIGPSADGGAERRTIPVAQLIALTGKTGDHSLYRQLQVHQCYATEGPMKLAAALLSSSGAGGDCLDQTSRGVDTLTNPEPGFFILGSKSYGRRNDFLLRVGYQQVAEVFEHLGSAAR